MKNKNTKEDFVVVNRTEIRWKVNDKFSVTNLKLDPTNPRLSSFTGIFTDKEITKKLWEKENTKSLYTSILSNGGTIEPLYIRPDGTVIEGNRRTVVLRKLREAAKKKEINVSQDTFDTVKVNILPEGTPQKDVDLFLAILHVTKKSQWAALDQARQIFRLHDEYGMTTEEIAHRIGISKGKVVQKLWAFKKTKEFLEKHPDQEISDYSFFEELHKKRQLRQKFNKEPEFCEEFESWILQNKFNDVGAIDIRHLENVMASKTAFDCFKKNDMKKARVILSSENPAYGAPVFQSFEKSLQLLKSMPLNEFEAIPKNPGHVSLIKELKNEIDKRLKQLGEI